MIPGGLIATLAKPTKTNLETRKTTNHQTNQQTKKKQANQHGVGEKASMIECTIESIVNRYFNRLCFNLLYYLFTKNRFWFGHARDRK
jgi:hypothetical protein